MAEFCLKCFNELNETNYQAGQVWLEDDFCENCGNRRPCVFALRPKPLLRRLFGRSRYRSNDEREQKKVQPRN